MGRESSTRLLLNSGLSGSMSLEAGQSWDSDSLVGPDDRLLGCDHLSSSGHIRNREESSDGITVRIVGAGCSGQTSGQLGGGEGRSHKGENHEGSHFVSEGVSQSFSGIYFQ